MNRRDFIKTNTLGGVGLILAPSLLVEENKIGYYKTELPTVFVNYIENGEEKQKCLYVQSTMCTSFQEFLENHGNSSLFVYSVNPHQLDTGKNIYMVRAAKFDIPKDSVINKELHYGNNFEPTRTR